MIVRAVEHSGIFTKLCQYAQYEFWPTHIEAVLPDGRHIGSWYTSGVEIRPADYDHGMFVREQYFTVPATDEEDRRFYAFLLSQVGKPYDWRSILSFFLPLYRNRDWRDPASWFCSEFIGEGYIACQKLPDDLAVSANHFTVRDAVILTTMLQEHR
jgi:hypothetical protein